MRYLILLFALFSLAGCSMGGGEQLLATVGKPTDQRIAVQGDEIASIYNKSGDKVAMYIFAGVTNDQHILIYKKTGGANSLFGKSGNKTEKIKLTLHQSLRFADGSRIVFLQVQGDRIAYRRISL